MNEKVNINFKIMKTAVKTYAREKAETAGSSVIYFQDKKIIEENPLTLKKTVVAAKADY